MQRDNIDDEKKEIGSDVKIRADLFGLIGVLPFCSVKTVIRRLYYFSQISLPVSFLFSQVKVSSGTADADARARCNRRSDKCITTDHRTFADHSFATKNRSTGVDRYIILNRWVTFYITKKLSAACRKAPSVTP